MNDTLLQTSRDSHVRPEVDETLVDLNGTPSGDPRLEVMRVAEQWYVKRPEWTTFFREILGVHGVVRRLFPSADKLEEFEKSEQYAEVKRMLAKLRDGKVDERADGNKADPEADREPTRVITVRMPQSMHKALREEAQSKKTSMNTLCIVKLLQAIDDDVLPSESK
jgi:predicted HicB family RNase H-like nuclease